MAATDVYTLSLHDALPISAGRPGSDRRPALDPRRCTACRRACPCRAPGDRKSTRLNSSHLGSSYAVFRLKKKTGRTKSRTHWTLEPQSTTERLRSPVLRQG